MFTGLVVGHELMVVVALRGGVLGVGSDVEIQPGTVAQEDVGTATQLTTRRNR